LDLGECSHVVTTPLTCTATNIPLVRRRCILDFSDILLATLTLDPESVRDSLTSKTRAIVNVHLHGVISDLPDFGPVPVIDDAAQALGPPRPGARFTAYSFQAIKHITTGDGGMLVCARPEEAREAKLRRWFGIDRALKLSNHWQPFLNRKILFDIRYPGYKFQMNDIAAALGIAGLRSYDDIMAHRTEIFQIYAAAGLPLVDGPSNYYGYACVVVEDRDRFCNHLARAGVETNVMHVRNDAYAIFQKFRRRPLPRMDWIEPRYVCIPLHNRMSLEDAWHVAKTAVEAMG
jgi:dTDP-4-amino-4,6-dideoxygalactose transaminase